MDVDIESSSKLETKSSIEEDLGDISQQNDTNQESISQQQDMESSMIVDGDTMKQSNKENQPRQSNGSEIDVNSKDELSPESVPIGNDHIFEGQQMITDQPTYISTPFHSRFTELGTMDSPLSPIKRRKLFTESSLQTPFSVKSSKKLSHLDKFKTPLKQTTIATPKPSQKSRSSFEQGYKGYQLMAEKLNIVNKSMVSVLPQSHKVLTTRNWRVGHEEIRFTNIMDRVEKLKEEQLWSFKQLKKHVHPPRPKLQWDYMLEEMQWLSEDFRQEKKWKIVAAHNMANWVMDWHKSIDKSTVCIKYRPIQYLEEKKEEIESQLIDLAEAGSPTGQDLDVDSSLVLDVNNQVEQIPIKPDDKPPVSVWKVPITNNASIETASLTKPIIIDFESNLYSMEGSDDTKNALSHISTYGPPVYSEGQLYIEDDSIVPISHLMLGQCILEEGSRWDQFGQFRESFVPEPPTPKLPSLDRYNTSNESHALFGGTVIEDDDELLPNDTKAGSSNPSNIPFPPPNCLKPDHAQISAPWGLDEQDALWQLTSVYSGNWNLIAESLNSCRFSSNSNRTNWCCFNKYVELNESSYKPVGKSDYLYSTASQTKAEKKAKVLKIFSTFTFIGSMAKKRDASRSHVPKSNKQVNLQAHDTHKHSQVAAGVDVNMRPFDIGKLKERRDLANEQMRNNQLFNSSRHVSFDYTKFKRLEWLFDQLYQECLSLGL
ncbi:hypothetical protein BC833DRAFT_247538 [Globomyces pollinis-pini]|nr:hypothetical protein BC833DRAFT_247538 [Globomyces pollinis-pini]